MKGDSSEGPERREHWRKSLSRLRARGGSNSKQNVVEILMTNAILMTEVRGVVLDTAPDLSKILCICRVKEGDIHTKRAIAESSNYYNG